MNLPNIALSITAVDASTRVFERAKNHIKNLADEANKLSAAGKTRDAWLKRGVIARDVAAWGTAGLGAMLGVHNKIAQIADAREYFNKIKTMTGQSEKEAAEFKANIYKIAAETARKPEELLEASIRKIRRGMKGDEIIKTLASESTFAAATHSKNLGQISVATYQLERQMKLLPGEAHDSLAGIMELSSKGTVTFEDFLGGANALMNEASAVGLHSKKAIMQIYAAAQVASRDASSPEEAMGNVSAFLADLKSAKTAGTFEKHGINLQGLINEAVKKGGSGDAMGDVVSAILGKVKREDGTIDEIALNQILKSDASRSLVRSMAQKDSMEDYLALTMSGRIAANKNRDLDKITHMAEEATKDFASQKEKFDQQVLGFMDVGVAPALEVLSDALQFLTQHSWLAKTAVTALGGAFVVSWTAKGITWAKEINKGLGDIGLTGENIKKAGGFVKNLGKDTAKVFTGDGLKTARASWASWGTKLEGAGGAKGKLGKALNYDLANLFKKQKTIKVPTSILAPDGRPFTKEMKVRENIFKGMFSRKKIVPTGLFDQYGNQITKTTGGLRGAAAVSWKFVASLWAQATAWAATPIGMITIAVAALIGGAILLYKNWDKVTAFFKKFWGWIKTGWAALKSGLAAAWDWIKGLFSKVPGWVTWFFPVIKIPMLIIQNWTKIKAFFSAVLGWVKGLFGRIIGSIKEKVTAFKDAGVNMIKSIWEGIKSFISKPIEAVKGMVDKIRKFLPFSPAKEGPLRDIHKIRIVETIADGIKDAPLTKRIGDTMAKARKALADSPLTWPAKTLKSAAATALAVLPAAAQPLLKISAAPSGRPAAPIQITINIDARGAAPGVKTDIEKAILAAVPKIEKALEAAQDRRARASNTGRA